ncbi:MAG: hypothetical protein JSS42_07490 [Proteobacteria bacterium]|nr:hypothetical protein [Pseudomonadota bacterium]
MATLIIKQKAYAAIEARFACLHTTRELRLRIIEDGRPFFYGQCTRCGNAGRAISKRDAIGELKGADAPMFDAELQPKWRARKHAAYVATYHAIEPELEAEYQAYLSSPAWYAKREAAIQEANGVCVCCQHFPATQAHHVTYERIGCEAPSDLMAVCSFCHGLIHGKHAR